jgi:hypothetical protein
MLKVEFEQIEHQMIAQLENARTRFSHAGDKGAVVEKSFREFLKSYLPRRLAIGNGEIVDSHGGRSGQTDVVIVNEDHPFTFTDDLPGLFFIEGVVGAAEIKSVLNSDHLEKTIKSSRKFKELKSEFGHGTEVKVSSPTDLKRYYSRPPFFLFAFESNFSLDSVCKRLRAEIDDKTGNAKKDLLDAVFIAGQGWLINFGDGTESFRFQTKNGDSLPGWQGKKTASVLVPLLSWLSYVMPKMKRVIPVLHTYLLPSKDSSSPEKQTT